MIKRKERKRHNKKLIFISAMILLSVLIFFWFGSGGFRENLELRKRIEDLDIEIEALIKQNRVLENEIINMKKDPEYLIEKIAREELLLKKENETIMIIEEEKDDN